MKIAIIDDSSFSRNQLKRALSKYFGDSLQLDIYANGEEALAHLLEKPLDLVTLDLVMPEPDGFKVLHELRSRGLKTPILIASADIQKTTREKCEAEGCSGFLQKPFTDQKVAQALQQLGL